MTSPADHSVEAGVVEFWTGIQKVDWIRIVPNEELMSEEVELGVDMR